jgi:hypothetical protein
VSALQLTLLVTIQNQTDQHLTLKSATDPTDLPPDIPPGSSPQIPYSTWWQAIHNEALYFVGDQTHVATFTWYVQRFGDNSYTAQIAPDDGSYWVTGNGGQGRHVSATYTVLFSD